MTYDHNAALARAEQLVADAEAAVDAGTDSYAEQNLKSARARVERLSAEVSTAAVTRTPAAAVAIPATPTPAPVPAAPAPKPAPVITGTRVERLQCIAAAFGTDERTLEAAIDDGTTPDEFAMIASDEAAVKAKAREILEG